MAESSTLALFVRAAGIGSLVFVVLLLLLAFTYMYIMSGLVHSPPINLDGVEETYARRMTARETEVDRIMLDIDAEVARRGGQFADMSTDVYRREVEAIYDMRDRAILRAGAFSWWDLSQLARERAEEDFIRSRHPTLRPLFLFVNNVMRRRP